MAYHALEDIEVAVVVMCVLGDDSRGTGIPDHYIGIGTHFNPSFLWVQIEDLSGVRAGHSHEATRIQKTGVNPLLPHHGEAVLHAVHSIGYLGEVALAQLLLRFIECAIVTAGGLQVVTKLMWTNDALN